MEALLESYQKEMTDIERKLDEQKISKNKEKKLKKRLFQLKRCFWREVVKETLRKV